MKMMLGVDDGGAATPSALTSDANNKNESIVTGVLVMILQLSTLCNFATARGYVGPPEVLQAGQENAKT